MIDIKNFYCDCGIYSTPPKEINSICGEHMKFCIEKGYEYRESLVEYQENITILKCPECKKELYRKW